MAKKFSCPSCGAEVVFKSNVSVFGVCTFCRSTLVRHDVNLETLGKMAELPADMSPIQLGVRGQFEKKSFEIAGRVKVGWEQGNWNEWFAFFDDGREGWLAEAQGQYMMSFAESRLEGVPKREAIRVGQSISLFKGRRFEIDDIKEAICIGSEGELPKSGIKGKRTLSVDLTGPAQTFANIEYGEDSVRLYVGRYVEFDDLKLAGLREIDGW